MESNLKNENTEESKESTTTFIDDGTSVDVIYKAPSSATGIQVRDQAIRDFMMKPVMISNYSWPNTAVAGDLLPVYTGAATRLDVATCLLANTYWANKIQGFQLIRGTVVFRLTINASPFQAGRLLMHFLPCAKDFNTADLSFIPMHNATLAGKTMQPSVEIDCRDSVAILKMPYVAPTQWYDIKTAQYDWGSLFLTVLSPLFVGTGQETTVDYSLYISFEDFELAAPLVPQSSKKFSASNRESQALSEGPITAGLKTISSIAGGLSSVPSLSSLAAPVSWVTNQLSGIASAFGWSKPTSEAHVQPMVFQTNRYSATSGGADSAYPLAMIPDNRLSVIDSGSIYSEDEMSFNFLKTKTAYIRTLGWSAADVAGTSLLTSFPVRPSVCAVSGTDTKTTNVATFLQGPPIFYLSINHFGLWRGGIDFIFKVVKTDFHIGRLQVTFTPSRYGTDSVPDLSTSLLSMREIIDLRSGNEFCFTMPYIQNVDYLKQTECSGYINILVLNELRAPSTVKDSVTILMYVRGAEDFELEMPVNLQYPVFSPQMNSAFSSGNKELVCETIGNYRDPSNSISHAAECVGEAFTSIKQLLNRHCPVFLNSFNGSAAVAALQLVWWPFHRSIVYHSAAGALTPILSQDAYSAFGPMYAFFRGGVRVQFTPFYTSAPVTSDTSMNIQIVNDLAVPGTDLCLSFGTAVSAPHFAEPLVTTSWYAMTTPGGATKYSLATSSGVVQTGDSLRTVTAAVPYYNRVRMSLGLNQTNSNLIPIELSQPRSALYITDYKGFNGGNVSRSFNDDFQLMYFIGCPPVAFTIA